MDSQRYFPQFIADLEQLFWKGLKVFNKFERHGAKWSKGCKTRLKQVIQTAKLFMKFIEQLNRSCTERKRTDKKPEKKPEIDMSVKNDLKKKQKLENKPKELISAIPLKTQAPAANNRIEQPKQDRNKKNNEQYYSFKDQKIGDLRIPAMDGKDQLPPSPYPGMQFPPPYFNHPHAPIFHDGIPFMQPVDHVGFPFFWNKPMFPNLYYQANMSPQKLPYIQMGPYVNQKPYMMQQPIVPKEPAKSIPKPLGAKENKIFSRASYHVAIAYDIHLHKIRKNSANAILDPNILDPTYKARHLKEQKGGDRQENTAVLKQSEPRQIQEVSKPQQPVSTPAAAETTERDAQPQQSISDADKQAQAAHINSASKTSQEVIVIDDKDDEPEPRTIVIEEGSVSQNQQ